MKNYRKRSQSKSACPRPIVGEDRTENTSALGVILAGIHSRIERVKDRGEMP